MVEPQVHFETLGKARQAHMLKITTECHTASFFNVSTATCTQPPTQLGSTYATEGMSQSWREPSLLIVK